MRPTADLLIELGCEDLPARYVQPLAQALTTAIAEGLDRVGIVRGEAMTYATPRRIAVSVTGVEARQADQNVERKGPALAAAFKDGKPTPAAQGFARSCGVDVKALKQEDGYLVFRKRQKGRRTAELLPELFEAALKAMDTLVPKRMRWGDGDETFVRPVLWLVALLGTRVVPLTRFGLKAGRKTYGHRFHAPQAISLKAPADYVAALRGAHVWADVASRRDEIRRQIGQQAAAVGGHARVTEDLLDEVTALVEWPAAITGRFEARFLELPPEVIVATVETNQRYFTVFEDATMTRLTNAFITIANIESKDVGQVIAGNERVVRPRLSDALFFWQQDRRRKLADYAEKFAHVTYQRELGTLAARVERLQAIARMLAETLGEDVSAATRAAALCKCDLGTAMVGEFPELQGIMGGYYALADGEPAAVADAVRDHYLPTQQDTPIPSTPLGRITALADKLDALAGYFAIGQKPTASKDPYGLRRAALGVIRIAVEAGLALDLRAALRTALDAQPAGTRDAATLDTLWAFVMDRLRGYCQSRGATAEQFEAVLANAPTDLSDFERRLHALRTFAGSPAAASLAAADKRARNILRQAGGAAAGLDTARLEHPAERSLAEALDAADAALAPLRGRADYAAMLARLAELKGPVDAFFDGVMVMADDPALRANRLALLARLDALCREVADLSQLPG